MKELNQGDKDMVKIPKQKVLTEQVLEVRNRVSGLFLDVRGEVADFVRDNNFLPHWKIEANVVNFFDEESKIEKEGAFIGYKNAGYISLNPPTDNFFKEKANKFWKLINTNKRYQIPEPTRFGLRTKIFIPSQKTFEEINNQFYELLFSSKGRSLLGGKQTDLQFTVELNEAGFNLRITGGPIHKDEAKRYFQFDDDEFKNTGLFLDIDIFKNDNIRKEEIPSLIQSAVDMTLCKRNDFYSLLNS